MPSSKQRAETVAQGLQTSGIPKDRLVKLLKVPTPLTLTCQALTSLLELRAMLLCHSTGPLLSHCDGSRRREIC